MLNVLYEKEIRMSKTVTIERIVERSHLASQMKSGSLDVLATPQMIAWMEEASCQVDVYKRQVSRWYWL